MTNCLGLPGIEKVLNTQDCKFKNRESPGQTRNTFLHREKLPSSGERLASVLRPESISYQETLPLSIGT